MLNFTFDGDVSGSLGTDDLVVQNLTTNQTIPSDAFSLAYETSTNIATFTYSGTTAGIAGMLPDGNYTATLLAAGITTIPGATLAANYVLPFRFLQGDANNDGGVNLLDFNLLASNFGQSPRTFAQGDFNYDGLVNLSDFNILATRFGQSVGPQTFGGERIATPKKDSRVLDELLASASLCELLAPIPRPYGRIWEPDLR